MTFDFAIALGTVWIPNDWTLKLKYSAELSE